MAESIPSRKIKTQPKAKIPFKARARRSIFEYLAQPHHQALIDALRARRFDEIRLCHSSENSAVLLPSLFAPFPSSDKRTVSASRGGSASGTGDKKQHVTKSGRRGSSKRASRTLKSAGSVRGQPQSELTGRSPRVLKSVRSRKDVKSNSKSKSQQKKRSTAGKQ